MYNYRYYYRLSIAYYSYIINKLSFSKAFKILYAFHDSKRCPEGRNIIPAAVAAA